MSKFEIQNPFLKEMLDYSKNDLSMLELPMNEFIEVIQEYLSDSISANKTQWEPEEYPLMAGQALYIVNYANKKVIYQSGFEKLLGYPEKEVTVDLLSSYFHPDQKDMLQRILKASLNFGISQDPKQEKNTWMLVTFKARKKDRTYIPLLRQTSIYEKDINGHMLSSFSILSDLTGMNNAEKVEWKFKGIQIDEERFHEYIYESYANFLTGREIDVLKHLEEGFKSHQIANKLFISKNTVDTHRRNMLEKASCANTLELLRFARQNGIL